MTRVFDAGVCCAVSLLVVLASAAQPAAAATSTLASPSVVFSTPGTKQVSLTACMSSMCDAVTQTVVVLDPMPLVTSATTAISTAEVGQLVRLDGSGTGRPPLTYTWQVTPLTAPSFTLSGSPVWWDTTGFAPGVYTVAFSVSNTSGTAVSTPFTVTLLAPQAADFYTITPCRAYDSRTGLSLSAGSSRTLGIAAACGIPPEARAVALNVTVANPTGQGNATLYPGNYPQPTTNTISFNAGVVRSCAAVVPLATDATGTLGVSISLPTGGSADVVIDVSGYFLVTPSL